MSRTKEHPKDEFKSRSCTKKLHALEDVQNGLPPGQEKFSSKTDDAFDRILRSCEPDFFDSEPDLSIVRFGEESDPEDNENEITVRKITIDKEEEVRSKLNIVNIDDGASEEDIQIINRFLLRKQKKNSQANWHTQGHCNVVKNEALKSEKVYPSTSKAAYSSTSNQVPAFASEIVEPTTSQENWPFISNEELEFAFPTIKSEASSSTTYDGPSTSAPATDMKGCFEEIEQLLSEDNESNRIMFSAPAPPPYNNGMFESKQIIFSSVKRKLESPRKIGQRQRITEENLNKHDPLNKHSKHKKQIREKIEQERRVAGPTNKPSVIQVNPTIPLSFEQYKLMLEKIHLEEELRHQKELEKKLQELIQQLQLPRINQDLSVDFELYKLLLQKLQLEEELRLQQEHDQQLK